MNTDFLALLKVMRWFYLDKRRWGSGDFQIDGANYAYLIEPWESICIEDVAAAEKWSEDDWWENAHAEVAARHDQIVRNDLAPLGTLVFDSILDGDAAWGLSVVIVRCHDRKRQRRC